MGDGVRISPSEPVIIVTAYGNFFSRAIFKILGVDFISFRRFLYLLSARVQKLAKARIQITANSAI